MNKEKIRLIAFAFFFVEFLVFFLCFLQAYFSPEKAVILWINNYGEADIEIVALSLLFIAGFFVLTEWFNAERMARLKKEELRWENIKLNNIYAELEEEESD